MSITAQMVKDLRDRTGAGMMDAKKALTETGGDVEAAVDWLRTKGLAKAAKKVGRTAAEGLVGVAVSGGIGVAVELNSETDFVARSPDFQAVVGEVARAALGCADLEALKAAPLRGKSVAEVVTELVATIGENLTLRRMARVEGEAVASYVHNAVAENMGRIGVLVALQGADGGIGRQFAMHVAAANPAALSEADLDPALIARERQVLSEQARASGKPEAVIEKMIDGRMKKFYEEVCLLRQKFVINPDITVGEAAEAAGMAILGFARFAVGEGIDREPEDFAAEVAKAAGR
ncbi:MAG TPA: translation elongation factor Ts [Paracoccaceae bacterium]|nr:translation elongation factor Ts [Paracoccaceae bacterium]